MSLAKVNSKLQSDALRRALPSFFPAPGCVFVCLMFSATSALPDTKTKEVAATEDLLPSAELLEFLAEFDDVNDETFGLIVTRALKDVDSEREIEDTAARGRGDGGLNDQDN